MESMFKKYKKLKKEGCVDVKNFFQNITIVYTFFVRENKGTKN